MTPEVTYCDVQDGWPGMGNIDADPLFVDADGLDNVIGTIDDNLRLLGGSPCLDAGNNLAIPPSLTTDLDGNPRIINGIVDMGAYEGPKQGLVVIPRSVTVPEGGTNTFTVALGMDPAGTIQVGVAVESGDPDITVRSGATLVFDSSNYSQPQTVTLTAAEDEDYLNGTASISVSSAGFNPVVVRATEADNENVIYVDADAGFPGADDGSSWADAFKYLQDALRVARSGDQILVAKGIYKPDQGAYQPPCERTATVQLISGVAIRGGYAGFGEPNPDARDIELYETILSGDLRGNDTDFNDSDWQDIFDFTADPNRCDNSYSVVTGSGTDSTAVLDGFTITGGNANGPILGKWPEFDYRLAAGAGMYNVSGSPTVINCTFLRNTTRSPYGWSGDGCTCGAEAEALALGASGGPYCSCTCWMVRTCGAAMFNCKGSPTLRNCRFIENVTFGADAFSTGGAIFNADSRPTIIGCTFIGNLAEGFDSEYYGGAVYDCNSITTYLDCSFIGNSAEEGGALFSDQNSTAALSRCVFAGNRATHGGAAIHGSGARLSLVNCTLAGNRYYCTLACDHWQASSLNVANSILWDGGNEVSASLSDVQITFSDVQGGWEGQGNINVDPCFAQAGYWDPHETPEHPDDDLWVNGDYHLRSQAGRWDANDGRWTKDDVTSLCIDAGDPSSPIGLEPFPNGGIINMGAYGGTIEASKSYFGEPVCETVIAGDINGDCKVNFKDFAIMAYHWLEHHSP
jgi:predicted outer membrane repeat protein